MARHGSYARSEPPGMRVRRWYCREGRTTFSLLPDCMAARLTGSLDEVEQVVEAVEGHRSVEAAASVLRPDIELPGAVRWVRRRTVGVYAALLALLTLMPGRLGTEARVRKIQAVLQTQRALLAARELGAARLDALPRPLGFGPAPGRRNGQRFGRQHKMGHDPPGLLAV